MKSSIDQGSHKVFFRAHIVYFPASCRIAKSAHPVRASVQGRSGECTYVRIVFSSGMM